MGNVVSLSSALSVCVCVAKETYYTGKRDLLYRQKRPTIQAKETYYRGKGDHKGTESQRAARCRGVSSV